MTAQKCMASFRLMLIAVILLGSSGCTSHSGKSSAPQTVVVVCIDRSDATGSSREDMIRDLDSFEKSAAEAGYPFSLWAYDRSAASLWGTSVPDAEDQTSGIEISQLEYHKGKPPTGNSSPSALFQALAADPQLPAYPQGRIVVLTSPESVFSDIAAVQMASKSLADRPEWRIAVIGVGQKNQELWREALSGFGNRVDLTTADQANGLLRQNRDE